ncbi:MAG: hypothetical protein M5T52_03110 [Ignavibacteriaceae bacterium]|nr:hypothetical protein [Ignavibacteriaceae bacterium]
MNNHPWLKQLLHEIIQKICWDYQSRETGTKIKSFVSRKNYPDAKEYFIPGDVSSAMFFIVLALIVRDSELIIKDISLNPTRTECLNILKQMGGRIQIDLKGVSNNEVFGDVIVKSSRLSNIIIRKEIIPLIIDEIPILAIAGIFADGNYELRGASELRVKESDRIKAICKNLLKIGLTIDEHEDGFSVIGLPKILLKHLKVFTITGLRWLLQFCHPYLIVVEMWINLNVCQFPIPDF